MWLRNTAIGMVAVGIAMVADMAQAEVNVWVEERPGGFARYATVPDWMYRVLIYKGSVRLLTDKGYVTLDRITNYKEFPVIDLTTKEQ
jgi:hypothetical protein